MASVENSEITVSCGRLSITTRSLALRELRWRIASEAPAPAQNAFWATWAGYLGNNFLPARAGELIRSMLISAETQLSNAFLITTALSSE